MGPRTSDGKKKPRGRKRVHGAPDGGAVNAAGTDDNGRVPAANDANATDNPSDPDGLITNTPASDEPAQSEPVEPDAPVYRSRFANLASPEAGWAVPCDWVVLVRLWLGRRRPGGDP